MEDIPVVISQEDLKLGIDFGVLNRVSLFGTGGFPDCLWYCVC